MVLTKLINQKIQTKQTGKADSNYIMSMMLMVGNISLLDLDVNLGVILPVTRPANLRLLLES